MQFLLDATLGYINIEQNEIVKTLTVASVVGIPPVLVAGIYGNNGGSDSITYRAWHETAGSHGTTADTSAA